MVLVCILLVGNDDDEDRGELGGVDRFGVTEVSENRDFSGASYFTQPTAAQAPSNGRVRTAISFT